MRLIRRLERDERAGPRALRGRLDCRDGRLRFDRHLEGQLQHREDPSPARKAGMAPAATRRAAAAERAAAPDCRAATLNMPAPRAKSAAADSASTRTAIPTIAEDAMRAPPPPARTPPRAAMAASADSGLARPGSPIATAIRATGARPIAWGRRRAPASRLGSRLLRRSAGHGRQRLLRLRQEDLQRGWHRVRAVRRRGAADGGDSASTASTTTATA